MSGKKNNKARRRMSRSESMQSGGCLLKMFFLFSPGDAGRWRVVERNEQANSFPGSCMTLSHTEKGCGFTDAE